MAAVVQLALPLDAPSVPQTCTVDGCDRELRALGLCSSHYWRRSHGRPLDAPFGELQRQTSPPVQRACAGNCGREVLSADPRRLCSECRAGARRASTERYRKRVKAAGVRPFLRDQHEMTEADYQEMLDAQDGRCAGCSRMPPIAGKNLHIDHDHSTCHPQGGRSCERCRRGLLCAECNMALGLLHDNPATLLALADYVREGGHRGR